MFLAKGMQHLNEKMQCSAFPVSPGSAEALVRSGGKIKCFDCLLSR